MVTVGVWLAGLMAALPIVRRIHLRQHRIQPGVLGCNCRDFWVRRLTERFPNEFGDGQHEYTAPTD